jgi:hypothetical protein
MSNPEKPLDVELAGIEATLGSLTPASSSIARDRLMYLAGRASVTVQPKYRPLHSRSAIAWLWPCVTTVSLLVAAAFATLWASNLPSPGTDRRLVGRGAGGEGGRTLPIDLADNQQLRFLQGENGENTARVVDVADSPHHNSLPAEERTKTLFLNNRQLCQLVLEKGIDALPSQEISPSRAQPMPLRQDSYRDLRHQLLDGSSI